MWWVLDGILTLTNSLNLDCFNLLIWVTKPNIVLYLWITWVCVTYKVLLHAAPKENTNTAMCWCVLPLALTKRITVK